jgi:deoxyinosine 3'endonuclease (endonuclease V)
MAPLKAPRNLQEAWIAEQQRLAKLCVSTDELDWCVNGQSIEGLAHVGGVDISFFPDGAHAVAAVVVISYPAMEVVYERCATFKLKVPYVTGFLAFREVPALKAMLESVPSDCIPQAVLVDGNGIFHPRKCGSATHLGIVTGLPTIGVAKDVLKVGDVNATTARKVSQTLEGASSWAPLVVSEGDPEPLAVLLRPSHGKKELVVSTGHKVSLDTAIALVTSLCKTSIPEPIRQADLLSRAAVRSWFAGVPVPRLKMPKECAAGNLLYISLPGAVTSDKENCVWCGTGDAVNNSAVQPEPRGGKSGKAKKMWRIKAVPRQNHTDDASSGLRENAQMTDKQNGGLWRLVTEALCGLCLLRK